MVTCLLQLVLGYKLQKICCNRHLRQGTRTWKVEALLKGSNDHTLKRLLVDDNVTVVEAMETIVAIRSIASDVTIQFSCNLDGSLSQIYGYRQLISDVESVRKESYSSENPDHEALLMSLWTLLRPSIALTRRVSRQWTEIGFQGDDPMTDFRGMGLLGLRNLVYFVTNYTHIARQLLENAANSQFGYSFAIVGINLTGMAVQLLNAGHFRSHFYNAVSGPPSLQDFHQVYAYLVYEFDKFWYLERPRDIMQFNAVKSKFQKQIVQRLRNKTTVLTLRFDDELSNHVASVEL